MAGQVAKLKEQPGGELPVIDEYLLLIFSVHLGAGKKLFRLYFEQMERVEVIVDERAGQLAAAVH